MAANKKSPAEERNGFLFDPGGPVPVEDLKSTLSVGKRVKVVRWPYGIDRPCLADVQSDVTLCGKLQMEAVSISKTPSSEGYCQLCLSRVGMRVIGG